MTHEEAIAFLNTDDYESKGYNDAIGMAIKALEDSRWIPVSEGLPKEKLAVLVWCPQRKNIYCAYYDKRNANKVVYSEWFIFGAFNTLVNEDVVAWMPLPKPYEEGVEDGTD